MDRALVVKKIETLVTRPSRVVDVLREPRPMTMNAPVANALGLQVVRTLKERALWHARASRVTPKTQAAYDTLCRDGVVVIPNFLPDDVFAGVLEEYEASREDPARRWLSYGENIGVYEIFVSDYLDRYPKTSRALRDNEFLLELASAISRRRRTYKPHTSFFTVSKPDPSAPHVDFDYNQYAHADRHYAFIKAFFYLNDVDEDTAPFSYAKGSHRFSSARLRFEYEYSRSYCRIRSAREYERTKNDLNANQELRDLADRLMKAHNQQCLPIAGRANTLIVANNQGFHKRGEFRSNGYRATVNMDFKYLESVAQPLYPVLKHFYLDP